MNTIIVKILKSDPHSVAAKRADAEIHFAGGELDGLKLVGFAVWRKRDGSGQSVSFPSRHFVVRGERRLFSLLRWIADRSAHDRFADLVLRTYRAEDVKATAAQS